ncbi:class I SAM-dependent methyltransferase [Methylovorus glucosotrophus]|uniref:Methyltransferase domain-containing protein n=1 Tax=Methylovorus glucosotrophus (strain SIP3-4) TaxID=582744 RepID=C6XBW8_METGS|nr:class I SAM-dependent methyltransferase [Methylovorus glucosotrophus]ACT50043.1 hypothetical protein Msip34_0795 [Methylovorus glucosotrophus SIP3-4]
MASESPRVLPATLALLIQLGMLGINLLIALLFGQLTGRAYPFWLLVLIQAVGAYVLARLWGMASWWRLIHLFFPLVVWLMVQLHLPNWVYLAGFLFSLMLFWTTFRTQVPFYPSFPAVWQQVLAWMPARQGLRMIDIGSGLGDMAMHIAKVRPDCQMLGIEVAPLPWLISHARGRWRRSSARFVLGDYHKLDFREFDVVFAYLSPAAMPALWQKASSEMRPGSLLISYEFEIPGVPPALQQPIGETGKVLYGWIMPGM